MSASCSRPGWRSLPVRTLLVDLDGTLLASHDRRVRVEFVTRSLWRLRRYGGMSVALKSLRAVRQAVECPSDGERAMTNAERGARAFAQVTGLGLAEADRVLRDEVGTIFPLLERHFYPVAGAREFIDWARPRYRLILATNPVWPIEQVLLRLGWSGIDAASFSSITHSGRMHSCKPSVEYYRELLEQEGLDPAHCALVGDDVRKDLPAARAGISVFILSPGRPVPEAEATPGAAWGSFGELAGLLSAPAREGGLA
jgi:FMN phosphatase YigB (HAD superfamily)